MRSRAFVVGSWLLALALVAALAVTAFPLVGGLSRPAAPEKDRLRIALPAVPHAALLHIAAEQGFFAAQGLDVTLLPVTHGRAAMERLRAGTADIAAMADAVFLLAVMRGEPLAVAASVNGVGNDNAVVARRDRGIAAPSDLAGKRIGVSFGTSGEYFLWAFLARHRLAPESVTLVDVAPNTIAAALAQGSIDAAASWSPIPAEVQAVLGPNAAAFVEADAYRLNFLLVGGSGFLRAHPRVVEKLLRAMRMAEQYQRTEPQAALDLVARRLKVDAGALQPSWADFTFKLELRQSLLVTLEDQARWAMARGYVAEGQVPNLLPNLYLDGLLAVQPERVSVVH